MADGTTIVTKAVQKGIDEAASKLSGDQEPRSRPKAKSGQEH